MAESTFTDEEVEAFADEGRAIALSIAPVFHGMSPFVAYNVVGNLVSIVFGAAQFDHPHEAMIEFDNWVKFTRQHLADTIKERMQ